MKCMAALLLLLTASAPATACSIVMFAPDHEFERSDVVVLARPMGVSFLPKQAADMRYTGTFRETVQWEVLLSWKGAWKSGDKFTTRRTYPASPCSYEVRLPDRSSAYLLYVNGSEPYPYYRLIPAEYSAYHMKHLSKRAVR